MIDSKWECQVFQGAHLSTTPVMSSDVEDPILRNDTSGTKPLNAEASIFHPHKDQLSMALSKLCDFQVEQSSRLCKIQEQQVVATNRAALAKSEPPIFTGDVLQYGPWHTAFNALIDSSSISDHEKLFMLGKYTTGKAHKMIVTYIGLGTAAAYEQARKILHDRFGHPTIVYEA